MNITQLQAKYGNATTTATTTAATRATGDLPGLSDWFKRGAKKTANVTVSAAKTTASVMPATNRKVNDIAAELNSKLNNHEKELWKHSVMIEMIAQATGVNLPEDTDLEEYYKEHLKQQEAEKQAAEQTKAIENIAEAAAPMFQKMMEMFQSMFGGEVPELSELPELHELELTAPVVEVPAPAAKPKPAFKFYRPTPAPAAQPVDEKLLKNDEELEEYMTDKKPQRRFNCAADGCKKKVHVKGDICDTCAAEPEEQEEAPAPKTTGRRKLGGRAKRTAPLAE